MTLLSLAVKNLNRRRLRTILTMTGVALSIATLSSLLSFHAGYERNLKQELEGMGINMLAVPKGCPYEAASLIIHGGVIPKYLSGVDLDRIKKVDGVEIAAPILLHQFFKDGSPHIVYGISPTEMHKLKPGWKIEGLYFNEQQEDRVMVVGSGLAEKEKLKVGQVLPFGPDKEPFVIIGILEKTDTQDDEFHFIPFSVAQRLFDKKGKMTAIAIRVNDLDRIAEVAQALEKIPDLQVVTMNQVMGTILNMVGTIRTLLFSILAVTIFVSGVGILNTLLMSVHERTYEFGMMKAIGASSFDLAKLVLLEVIIITIIGGVAGLLFVYFGATAVENWVKGMIPYAPKGHLIALTWQLVGFCLVFSIGIGMICGLYPAIKSARISPMEALREGAVE